MVSLQWPVAPLPRTPWKNFRVTLSSAWTFESTGLHPQNPLNVTFSTPFLLTSVEGLSLFVGDIGPEVTVDDLRSAFQDETNSVTDARIVMDPASGRTKGYGFVTFRDTQSAERALTKNGEILKGRKMRVNWAATTSKDAKSTAVPSPYMTPAEMYVPAIPGMAPMATPNEAQVRLTTMAQMEGLDPSWWMRLPPDIQASILRVSNEAPGAKVVWIGNLEKGTNRKYPFNDFF